MISPVMYIYVFSFYFQTTRLGAGAVPPGGSIRQTINTHIIPYYNDIASSLFP